MSLMLNLNPSTLAPLERVMTVFVIPEPPLETVLAGVCFLEATFLAGLIVVLVFLGLLTLCSAGDVFLSVGWVVEFISSSLKFL